MDLLVSFSDFPTFKEMMLFSRAHLVATTPKLKSNKAKDMGLKDKMDVDKAKLDQADMIHFESCIDKLQISGY